MLPQERDLLERLVDTQDHIDEGTTIPGVTNTRLFVSSAFETLKDWNLPVSKIEKLWSMTPKSWGLKLDDQTVKKLPKESWSRHRDSKWVEANTKVISDIPVSQLKINAEYYEQEPGKVSYKVSVKAGDISHLLEGVKKELAFEYRNKEIETDEYWADLGDKVYDIFSSSFEKEMENYLWKTLRHEGHYSGIELEVLSRPANELDFKNAEWDLKVFLEFEAGDIVTSKIEESLKEFFKNAP